MLVKARLIGVGDVLAEYGVHEGDKVVGETPTKESVAKVLVASTELKVDQYQKSKSSFEGDVIDLKLRMDNNSKYIGKYLTAKNVEIMAEAYVTLSVFAEKTCIINAFANSEIELFGDPIIELKKFTGKTILKKNTLK